METQMKQLLEDWASKRASLLKNGSCSLVWFCFCLVAKSPYETCDVDQARLDLVAGLCLPLLPQDQGHRPGLMELHFFVLRQDLSAEP